MNNAQAKLKTIHVAFANARRDRNTAQKALTDIKKTCVIGIDAAQFTNGKLQGAMEIKSISFQTTLAVANTGMFNVSVRTQMQGKPVAFTVGFNINNPVTLIETTANKLVQGLTDYIKR